MRFSYLFWSAFISIAIAGTFKDVLDDLQNKLDGPGNKGSFDQATDDELTIGTNAAIKGTNSFASAKNTCSDGFTVKFLKRGFGPAAPWNPFNRVCPAPVSDTDEKPATATKPEPKMLSTPNCRPGYRPYCCWRGPEKIPQRRQIAMKDYKLIEYCEPCTFFQLSLLFFKLFGKNLTI